VWQGRAVEWLKPAAIVDTCVCIDLCNGSLLDALTHLPYYLVIPDVIARDELKSADLHALMANGAQVETASAQAVSRVDDLGLVYPGLSPYDRFALAMAITRPATLLSSEKCLHTAAIREGVKTVRLLALLDMLETCLPPRRLADALDRIRGRGAFLPAAECDSSIQRWRRSP
jgi:hypothetical protein